MAAGFHILSGQVQKSNFKQNTSLKHFLDAIAKPLATSTVVQGSVIKP